MQAYSLIQLGFVDALTVFLGAHITVLWGPRKTVKGYLRQVGSGYKPAYSIRRSVFSRELQPCVLTWASTFLGLFYTGVSFGNDRFFNVSLIAV